MPAAYFIYRFSPIDWELYKAIRLEALRLEPGMFGNSHALESAFADEQWQQGVGDENAAHFGPVLWQCLIGLAGSALMLQSLPWPT